MFLRLFVICFLSLMFVGCFKDSPQNSASTRNSSQDILQNNISVEDRLKKAFNSHESGFEIEVSATVIKVLADDNEGSRHQKFLIKLSSGQTILVSHNIDLASRVENLKAGDQVKIYGQYEWSEKGGTIHWTHHDPHAHHTDGWIEREGQKYQ